MQICVFEDAQAGSLEPLAWTRPVFEVVCGQTNLLQKHHRFFGTSPQSFLVRPHLAEITRLNHSGIKVNEFQDAEESLTIFVNGRWLPPAGYYDPNPNVKVGLVGDEVAYAIVEGEKVASLSTDGFQAFLQSCRQEYPTGPAHGEMIRYPWDLVEKNSRQLVEDFNSNLNIFESTEAPEGVVIIGSPSHLRIHPSARVDPMLAIDTTTGPVTIDRHALVHSFSRIEGPCNIGPNSQVLGAKVRGGTTLGPHSRIGGEVETSILHGFSNKYHDGFLGHAYLGEWVNLGAGTQNSDLRNDYAEIGVSILNAPVKTGLAKVGCFIGDHTKTGLGTLINSGSNIGCFSNVLPSGLFPPRYLPSFTRWNRELLQEIDDLTPMFATAAKVMQRRGQLFTPIHDALYRHVFEETAFLRRRVLQDGEKKRVSRSA